MLKKILKNEEKSGSILILDLVESRGDKLLKSFLEDNNGPTPANLVFVSSENHLQLNNANPAISNINLVKISLEQKLPQWNIEILKTKIEEILKPGENILIVGSLTPFIWNNDIAKIAQFLNYLKIKFSDKSKNCTVEKIVVLVHSECHEKREISQLKSVFQTVLELEANPEIAPYQLCNVHHQTLGGKESENKEKFLIDEHFELKSETYQEKLKPVNASNQNDEDKSQDDVMKKLTTFNLGLKSTEKEARDKVVMPFWKPEQIKKEAEGEGPEVKINKLTGSGSASAGGGGGNIHYEPDEGDDWDDEDPDDDLDF